MMENDSRSDFSNKIIVVTGGTGVLLTPAVKAIVNLGGQVILLSRTNDEKKMETIEGFGQQPVFIATDVSVKSQLVKARDEIKSRFGRIDVLINGAGGNRPGATTSASQSFFDLPEEAVRGVFDVNFMGTLFACQVFGQVMADQKKGVILNISSMAALKPLTHVVSYSAAKAAVDNFTKWLAVHMAQTYSPQIRVNAIAPGFLMTKQNEYLLLDNARELTERGEQIIQMTPMGRFGDPGEMIDTILWLITEASSFVTGVVVPVDGGFSAFGGV